MYFGKIPIKDVYNLKQTTLCYIEKDNKYLMLYRNAKQNDINYGKWLGLGGHLENGETHLECMLREVYEETGLTPTKYKYRGVVNFISDIHQDEQMHLYSIYEYTGKIHKCSEGELKWIDKNKVAQLALWEGDKIFLNMISQPDTEFFELTLHYDKNNQLVGVKTKN